MIKNHNIIDVAAELRHETDAAFLLDDGDQKVWVPKSLVENNDDGTFQMPEWLAFEKNLI